jgi:hypothetical protein
MTLKKTSFLASQKVPRIISCYNGIRRMALASQKAPFAAGSINGVAAAKPIARPVQTSFLASAISTIELCGETPELLRNCQKRLDSKSLKTRFRKLGLKKTGYAVLPIPMSALNDNLRPNNRSTTSFTSVLAVHTVAVGHRLIYVVVPGTVHA